MMRAVLVWTSGLDTGCAVMTWAEGGNIVLPVSAAVITLAWALLL